jgi:hypothetical protein
MRSSISLLPLSLLQFWVLISGRYVIRYACNSHFRYLISYLLSSNCPQVFLSINTLILGASFLFGSAASSYFEGLLLIFVRRPYDIGDKVNLTFFSLGSLILQPSN